MLWLYMILGFERAKMSSTMRFSKYQNQKYSEFRSALMLMLAFTRLIDDIACFFSKKRRPAAK